jgi:RHS repeat-associated protein
MDICIANAPSAPCGDLTTSVYSMPGKPISPPAPQRTPYQRCEGLYPWFIYENQGNGTFLTTPRIIYSPVELESSTGDSPVFAPFVVSKDHAIMDLDGDGIIDAAKLDEAGKNWQIWLGDGTGAFEPHRYVFSRLTRPSYQFFAMNSSSYYGQTSSNGEGLIDLNGDGLPEHWSVNPSGANVAFHDGTGFEVSPIDAYGKCYGPCSGAMQLPILPSDATGYSNLIHDPNGRITGGSSVATKRVADVDADGRVDVVDLVPTPAQVYFNIGGQLRSSTADYPGNSLGLQRKVDAFPEDQDNTWEVTTELIDLNGDGMMESASFATAGLKQHEHVYGASPPRLLTRIENGRGAVTVVSYSSMHDKNVVEQHPDQFWPDGRPMASPNNQWVVRALATHDSLSSTTTTISHVYKNPRHGKNDEGRYGFRGFEEVEVTAPSGAKTVSRYDYQVDWSGRLVETRVHPAEALGDVRSIDRAEWTGRQSFGGAITTYHSTLQTHYDCKNDQAIEACLSEPAGATYTAITQTPFDVGGPTILWEDTETRLQAGLTVADGDRRTWSKYTLVHDATHYRFRQIDTTREQRVNGSWVMFGKSASSWDSDFKVELTNEVWVDADDSNTAITRFVYDMTTGNALQRFKPVQNAESGPAASYAYDSRKLFVVTETNELGHVRDLEYEYGTGTKLSTSGPNPAYCPGNCPPGMTCMPKERHAIVVDGLGREIQQWDTTGGPCTFPYVQRTETTYFDGTSLLPAWTRHRRRIDVNQSTWTDEKTEFDGHGRPTKETVFVQGTAPADQITTFTYEDDGTLSRVEVPDPSANTVARVAYTYTFDSLGRATSVRRPDATADIDKSGVDISYDGLTQTTSEVVGLAGGNPAVTKTVTDRFGRLVEVHEQLTPSPATWATTLYTYGPDDNVRTVTDPEAVTTALEHDFAGRRTAITRSGRVWKYTYDRNGNMKSELVPGADDLLDEINFKTFIEYDALDRPISKLVGQRHLSAPDQAAFGGNTESFLWDYGGNMIGYLRRWQSFAPNNPTPLVKVDAFVDSLGLQESTTQILNIAGYSNLQRKFFQNYNVMGAVKQAWYYDEFTYSDCNSTDCTNAVFAYDPRGLPSQIQLSTSAGPAKVIGNQTRNVAGLVTKRRTTPPAGGPMTYVESNWSYDRLGRVTSQVVQKNPAPVEIARQDLTYLGNDDPSSFTHWIGTTSHRFDFSFDYRHQLTNVASSTPGYFNATYEFGPAGRFSRASEQTLNPKPPGSEVQPRNVSYVYGGQDPEQVTQLIDVPSGNAFASFVYDDAGNQMARCLGANTQSCAGELLEYVYDGSDQLRRVTKKVGGISAGTEEYWYDASGARLAMVRRDAAGNKAELVTFTGDSEAHYDGSGAITYAYSHLSLGTPVARVTRTGNTTTETEYQFHGLASSTLAAVATDGTVNAAFMYTPFGEIAEAAGADGSNAFHAHSRRFNDKYSDELSGLTYYGIRYYDKLLISWTQADPSYRFAPDAAWDQPRRASLYTFAANNALRFVDPDGQDFLDIIAPVFGPLGIVANGLRHRGEENAPDAGDIAEDVVMNATGLSMYQDVGGVIGRADPVEIGLIAATAIVAHKVINVAEARFAAAAVSAIESGPLFRPGPFATASIEARSQSQSFRVGERDAINAIGEESGCHSCGAPVPGTNPNAKMSRSPNGNWVLDHQPVSSTVPAGTPARLFPQCLPCSRAQGLLARLASSIKRAVKKDAAGTKKRVHAASAPAVGRARKKEKLEKNMRQQDVPIEARKSF